MGWLSWHILEVLPITSAVEFVQMSRNQTSNDVEDAHTSITVFGNRPRHNLVLNSERGIKRVPCPHSIAIASALANLITLYVIVYRHDVRGHVVCFVLKIRV